MKKYVAKWTEDSKKTINGRLFYQGCVADDGNTIWVPVIEDERDGKCYLVIEDSIKEDSKDC